MKRRANPNLTAISTLGTQTCQVQRIRIGGALTIQAGPILVVRTGPIPVTMVTLIQEIGDNEVAD